LSKKVPNPKKRPTASRGSSVPNPMDVALLQQIVNLMTSNDLSMVDVRDGGRRIVLRRGAESVVMPAAPAATAAAASVSGNRTAQRESSHAGEKASLRPIPSPMVGTFYSAPSPDANPFVAVGAVVDEDTDVCIIEAMKVFNNIKAECRGKIARILVENGQPVEFGQTLFLVEPAE